MQVPALKTLTAADREYLRGDGWAVPKFEKSKYEAARYQNHGLEFISVS
jgi:hypothetical protein